MCCRFLVYIDKQFFYSISLGILNENIIFVNIHINNNNNNNMSSIAQLISEIAHSLQQPDSVPVRRAIKLGIVHARNEIIRKSYDSHKVTDKVLQQRFRVNLINVPDGDIIGTENIGLRIIKRTSQKVPRPTRLSNGVPFHSIRTAGVTNPIEISFVKEASSKFYSYLPGMNCCPYYDYTNDYIYININNSPELLCLENIIIESVFEQPSIIETETISGLETISDNDEYLIPEDMINGIKKLFFETFNPNMIRQTNEIPTTNLVK